MDFLKLTTTPSPAALTVPLVGLTSILVAPANDSRLGLYVFNPGANNIWIAPSNIAAAVAGMGSVLLFSQQGIMLGQPGAIPPWTTGLNAIATSGSSNPLTIWEFYK